MKKLLALLLALMLCVCMFAACAEETKEPASDDPIDTPDEPDQPDQPDQPVATGDPYIVVANDEWTIVTYYELTEDAKPATWVSGTSGLTGYSYGGVANLAPEGSIVAVKIDKLEAYAAGDLEDDDMIFIEQDDVDGKLVGTEINIVLNSDKTVKSFAPSGKSVVGELTITKSGDKFTAKIGDKVYLDGAAADAKLATKAFDSVSASGYYVSSATKKAVFAFESAENIDLQTVFGNDDRDVTEVGIFYDEFYNINYEGYVDGYDWDGDGKLDLVVVNRPHTVKATADSDGTSVSFGVLGDNHSYCGCGGWHTQSTVASDLAVVKNDILFVYEDYRIGTYNVIKPEVINAKLTAVDIANGKITVGDKTYNLDNSGDLPYLNSKPVTQYETDAQKAAWENSVGAEISFCVDKKDNVIWATLATEAQIVDAAWALEKGATMGTHTLTGKITSIDTAWSDQYSNITVTIVVGEKTETPIMCYRLKGEGAKDLAVGDTITVTGELLNYADSSEKGKVEFTSGCEVTAIVKAEPTTPTEPTTPDTPAPHTHAWDAGKVTKEATCKEEGVKTFTCTCGETKTEAIAKTTDHKYDEGKVTKEASCKEAGVKTFTCSVCSGTKTEDIAKTTDHKYDAGKLVGAETVFTCSVCGATKKEAYTPTATVIATIDKTDTWSLVIEERGSSPRVGSLAPAGKIAAGIYNKLGTNRTEEYLFDFASLGLEGKAWEYLGATVTVDISDPANPKVYGTITKSTFCVKFEDLSFPTDKSVKLSNGVEFALPLYYGGIHSNNLINDGGQYIPKWSDIGTVTCSTDRIFTSSSFTNGYYVFVKVSIDGKVFDLIADSKVDFNA